VRIIGGQYGGFAFHPPKSIKARPTTDRSKEALFNTLSSQGDLAGAKVLDLFTGTGNIAYEFASRGAEEVHCVDLSKNSLHFIQATFNALKYSTFKTFKSPVLKYLIKCDEQYDFIFADPPYALDAIPDIAKLVFERDLLKPGGILIIEHFKTLNISHKNFYERREYGQSVFSYFKD
jgi:16S rRNA (guanine(966)-N(2))-methyltransferase RsmD